MELTELFRAREPSCPECKEMWGDTVQLAVVIESNFGDMKF